MNFGSILQFFLLLSLSRSFFQENDYLRLFRSLIFWCRNLSSSRWYKQRFEDCLNVFKKFLLLRIFSQASHSVTSWLEDAHGLATQSFLRFVDGSSLVVFDWAVFDLVSGCNTFVDTKRFFRWFSALRLLCEFSCITSSAGTLSLVSLLHCLTVRTVCVFWWSVCVSASRVGEVTYNVNMKGICLVKFNLVR